MYWKDSSGLERKPGKTPPGRWPKPPEDVCGKKPKWNPDGYWDGKKGRRLTWDDRTHGTGQDRGDGPQGGHWDDETSDNRWDQNGRSLPGSPEAKSNFTALDWALGAGAGAAVGVGLVLIPEITVPVLVIGGAVAK